MVCPPLSFGQYLPAASESDTHLFYRKKRGKINTGTLLPLQKFCPHFWISCTKSIALFYLNKTIVSVDTNNTNG